MPNLEKFAKPLLRIAISLVFLYFGYQQISSPMEWAGFVPNFALSSGISAKNLVMMNSILELSLGILLLLGLFTKFASLILSLHLFGITLSLGFNDLGIRDFGLSVATFVVFLNGIDEYCLDKKWSAHVKSS